MSEGSTYQPGWGEKPKHHHHHHHHNDSYGRERNRGLGGALRMKDKQAYYGLMCILIVAGIFALGWFIKLVVGEFRAMPNDDPATELNVDALRINKAGEQDAIMYGDSLAQTYNLDSLRRNVQIDSRPVYRPPRKHDEWYLTQREWKALWQNFRLWRKSQHEEKENNQ